MKLVIVGSTGRIGTETVRRALLHPAITSVVALGRRMTPAPADVSLATLATKFRPVVCNDFEKYSDDVRQEFADSDACIWTIGITPTKSLFYSWDLVTKINHDYPIASVRHISQIPPRPGSKPFRFIYITGFGVGTQDLQQWPHRIYSDFLLQRLEVESTILETVKNSNRKMESQITRPGLLFGRSAGFMMNVMINTGLMIRTQEALVALSTAQFAAAMLDQLLNGFEKEILENNDLIRIGDAALAAAAKDNDANPS